MVAAHAMATDVPMGIALATVSVAKTETAHPKVEDNHRAMVSVVQRVIGHVMVSADPKEIVLGTERAGQMRIVRAMANADQSRVQKDVHRDVTRKTSHATRLNRCRMTREASRCM